MRSRRSLFTIVLLMGSLILLAACGGGSSSKNPPAVPLIVLVTPPTQTVAIGSTPGTIQFSASVTGNSNQGVTWSVSPTDGATVSAAGLFTPTHAGSYHVIATSAADSTRSSYAIVTVTAPAPEFSTTPFTGVSIAGTYTYTPAATDPRGNDVTLELTTEPEEGEVTFEEGTVSWVPPTDGGRKPFNFAITATTTEGGTATQSWTVYPGGTITVSKIDKYWYMAPVADTDPVEFELKGADFPVDMTGWGVQACMPELDGVLTCVSGTGSSDGTYKIDDVYGDKYFLYYDGNYYWTNSATYDLGQDYIGRPPVAAPAPAIKPNFVSADTINTTFDFQLAGLSDPINNYDLQLVSPNAGSYYHTTNPVTSTLFEYMEPATLRPIDPTLGDTTYVLQRDRVDGISNMSPNAWVMAITSALAYDKLATVADDTTVVAGSMGTAPSTFDFNVKGSAWASMFASAGPSSAHPNPMFVYMGVEPYVTDMYAHPQTNLLGLPLAFMLALDTTTDQDLGTFRYVNPYPADWTLISGATQSASIPVSYPESGSPYPLGAGSSFLTEGLPTGPIAPLMSAVKNPKVNGKDFFSPSTTETDVVTLSWDKPTGLTPYGYAVDVIIPSRSQSRGSFNTSDTSFTFPQYFLEPGISYIFRVTALANGSKDIETAPLHSKLPMAKTSVVSAAVTVNAPEPPADLAQKINAMRKTFTVDITRRAAPSIDGLVPPKMQ